MILRMRRRLGVDIQERDAGNAILIALFVGVIITGLGGTVAYMATNNTQNADRDRQGAMALDIADAGVAAAIEYLRTDSSRVTCPETSLTWSSASGWTTSAAALCMGAWNGPSGEQVVNVQGSRFQVWISQVQKAAPPTTRESVYRIRSEGISGSTAPGRRSIEATVVARPFDYPVGVYADTITSAGTADVFQQTIFSQGCIQGSKHMTVGGADLWYGGKASVRSTEGVTEKVNESCSETTDVLQASNGYCYGDFPVLNKWGRTTSSPASCYNLTTTKFTLSDLQTSFGLTARGLEPQQYEALKSIARSQGSYYTSTSGWSAPNPAVHPNAVLYFKISPSEEVKIQDQLNAYGTATCGARSLVIIVEGGSLHMNAQADIVGAMFVPDGNIGANGGADFTGTIFSKTIDKFNGTAEFRMDQCWLNNFPALVDIQVSDYRQVDR